MSLDATDQDTPTRRAARVKGRVAFVSSSGAGAFPLEGASYAPTSMNTIENVVEIDVTRGQPEVSPPYISSLGCKVQCSRC